VTLSWQPVLYIDADAEQLVDLCQLQPGKAAAVSAEYIRWLRTANPAGLAQVGLGKEMASGRIVGVLWFVPLRIQVGDQVLLGSQVLYGLVHPDWRGQGVFSTLMSFCNECGQRQGFQFTYAFPNPHSYPLAVRRLGYADIGEARLFIRPLNIVRLVTRRLGSDAFRAVPTVAGWSGARSLFRARPLGPEAAQVSVREMDTQDAALDDFWARIRGKYPVMVVRDVRFLHWRYTQIPGRTYRVLAARQAGPISAIVVLRNVSINGVSCGMVVDFLVESTAQGRLAGEVLLREAAADFQANDADLAGCLMLPHAEEIALLRRQGYVRCPAWLQPQPFRAILLTNRDTPASEVLRGMRSWFLTMGDFDAV
jgi:GNAT superfamily N-acetyltransferase